jgi:hypothetical protein
MFNIMETVKIGFLMLHRSNGSERPPVGIGHLRCFRSLFKMGDVLSTHSAFPHFRLRSWSITALQVEFGYLPCSSPLRPSFPFRTDDFAGK